MTKILELVLLNARTEKEVNDKYDSEEFLDSMLEEKDMSVSGNSVIVDNYASLIDREKLVIIDNLGETQINVTKEIKSYKGKNAEGKYEVEILLILESNIEIKTITIENPYGTTLKLETDKLKLGKNLIIELDKEYKVLVTTNDEKIETRKIIEKSEETIRTVEELVAFRDKVNIGLTYEGKTINLVADLELSSICYKVDGTVENDKSWKPIGNYQEKGENYTHIFKGTFKGNYHKIENLYINSDKDYQGLFGYVRNATITDVVIEGIKDKESVEEDSKIISTKGKSFVAGIIGYANNTTIENCGNNANILSSGIYIGGIVGYGNNNSKIEGVYNRGNITGNSCYVGGIVGGLNVSIIEYSYNIGNMIGVGNFAGGIVGLNSYNGKIYNSYNIGNIKGNGVVGGITSKLRAYGLVTYNYNLGLIENVGTIDTRTGGIVGQNLALEGSNSGSTISYSYNLKNVTSTGNNIGEISGENARYCKIQSCYISSDVLVTKGSTKATDNIGSSESYLGKLLGYAYTKSSTYVGNIDILSVEKMPTVYEVVNEDEVNGLNSENSEYWSKTEYSNKNYKTPKLKWESNVI